MKIRKPTRAQNAYPLLAHFGGKSGLDHVAGQTEHATAFAHFAFVKIGFDLNHELTYLEGARLLATKLVKVCECCVSD